MSFPVTPVMDEPTFQTLYTALQTSVPDRIQAYVITWTEPYRVSCMSVTSAFATVLPCATIKSLESRSIAARSGR